jgi:Fuc2NAc and GlcNAc transferase
MTLNVFKAVVLVATFCISLLCSGVVRRYALRARLLDIPNARSSHAVPTPRGGGVAIALSFFSGALAFTLFGQIDWYTMAAIAVGGPVAWIGFLDDKHRLSARMRFGVHLASAFVAVLVLYLAPGVKSMLVGAVGIFALAWATNLFNFMDGIDGLAACEAIFVSCSAAMLNMLNAGDIGTTCAFLGVAAATLGFLYWNWPPARLFMGDAGSGFLGFTLTVLALAASWRGTLPLEIWPILGGVFLVDSSATLIRRMLRGDVWFEAHRMHAYQHLSRRWQTHLPVTLLAMAINVLWLLPLAFYAASYPKFAALLMTVALTPLVVLVLLAGAGTEWSRNGFS